MEHLIIVWIVGALVIASFVRVVDLAGNPMSGWRKYAGYGCSIAFWPITLAAFLIPNRFIKTQVRR
jgi:bacteriorhodopsin